MNRQARSFASPGEQVARLAVAQILLLEATIESLSVLGERLAGSPRDDDTPTARDAMLEPFRARYLLLRELMREPPTRH